MLVKVSPTSIIYVLSLFTISDYYYCNSFLWHCGPCWLNYMEHKAIFLEKGLAFDDVSKNNLYWMIIHTLKTWQECTTLNLNKSSFLQYLVIAGEQDKGNLCLLVHSPKESENDNDVIMITLVRNTKSVLHTLLKPISILRSIDSHTKQAPFPIFLNDYNMGLMSHYTHTLLTYKKYDIKPSVIKAELQITKDNSNNFSE